MEEEINHSETFLRGISAKSGFQVPEGYFENLENRIVDKVSKTNNKQAKTIQLSLINFIAIAASIVVVMGLFWFDPNKQSTTDLNAEEIITQSREEPHIDFVLELLALLLQCFLWSNCNISIYNNNSFLGNW